MLRGSGEIAYVVYMVLVAVLYDGVLGELTIVGELMSGLARLMTVLYNTGSSGEVCVSGILLFCEFYVDC